MSQPWQHALQEASMSADMTEFVDYLWTLFGHNDQFVNEMDKKIKAIFDPTHLDDLSIPSMASVLDASSPSEAIPVEQSVVAQSLSPRVADSPTHWSQSGEARRSASPRGRRRQRSAKKDLGSSSTITIPASTTNQQKLQELLEEVYKYDVATALHDAWRLVQACRCDTIQPMENDPSRTKLDKLHSMLRYFDDLGTQSAHSSVRAQIGWRYGLAKYLDEQEKAIDGKTQHEKAVINSEFSTALGKIGASWKHHMETAKPLRAAVIRFGWGVLIFPLQGASTTRLTTLSRQDITIFLDCLEEKLPNLREMLRNVSKVVPDLLEQGLPGTDLLISSLRSSDVTSFNTKSFNQLFTVQQVIGGELALDRGEDESRLNPISIGAATSTHSDEPSDAGLQHESLITEGAEDLSFPPMEYPSSFAPMDLGHHFDED